MKSFHFSYPGFKTLRSSNSYKTFFVFSIFLLLTSCKQKTDQVAAELPALPVLVLGKSAETTYLQYPASIQGASDIDIRPQVSGYLQEVKVNEGAYVTSGQTLFKINENPFREALNNAKASLRAAQAAILNSQLEIDKLTPLVANKVVADFQLKTAQTAYKIALANADQAKAAVATALINLDYTNVKANVSGYIGRIPKKQGSLVSPTDLDALTQLSDIREMHVYFALGENDFNNFNAKYPGKTPADRLSHLPEVDLLLADNTIYPLKGKIDMIDGQFDKNTGAITLRATFPNGNGLLRSGNTGKIRLGLAHHDAVTVPESATIEMQDKIFVYTLDTKNKVRKQPISIIGTSGNNYLIKDGLKAGDRVILKGIETLKEGDAIQPKAPDFSVVNPK